MEKYFFKELLPDFSWLKSKPCWKGEFLGAFVGIILTIPQGIAFAGLVGVPPIHGIYSAIWVTLIASLWGNSTMMSGPNTAVAILIGLSASSFASPYTPEFLSYVLLLSFLNGVIQLFFWSTRAAKWFQYLTPATTHGLSTGVCLLIMKSSLTGLSRGWPPSFSNLDIPSLTLGLITISLGFLFLLQGSKYYIPIALALGTLSSKLFPLIGWKQAPTLSPLETSLSISSHWLNFSQISSSLILSAFFIAVLSYSQSLVIVRQLSLTTTKVINFNREGLALALSSIAAPYFSAFAGAGSFNRTQANQEMKVQTPLAGILVGLGVFFISYFFGDIFSHLPQAVISGILFIVGSRMIKKDNLIYYSKTPFLAFSFWGVLLIFLLIGLTPAIMATIAISIFSYIRGNR